VSGDVVVVEAEIASLPYRAISRLATLVPELPGFARASALVAVKLGISKGVGRRRDAGKVGSDAFDVARLLQRFGPDALADELTALGQPDFVERVSGLAQRHLVDDADHTAAAIIRSSVQGVQSIAADQLELLGRGFTRRLGAAG